MPRLRTVMTDVILVAMNPEILAFYRKYGLDRFVAGDRIDRFSLHRFQPGEKICESGSPIEYLSFLVEGRVKVFLPMENGRQLLLCFYDPPQVFGDLEIFQEQAEATTTIEAITPCVCLALSREYVLTRLAKESGFLEELCRSLGKKLGRVIQNSALNLLHPLENRIASYILATALAQAGRPLVFSGNLTQIADLLGTSFRHLHRTLRSLCDRGILRKTGTAYVVQKRDELERLAAGIYVVG